MREEIDNIITSWCSQVIEDIRQVLIDKNVNATGSLSDSLRPEIKENEIIIWAKPHAIWTDRGRGATKNDNGGELIEAIKEWVIAKRVNLNPYAITKKIHQEGTKLHREGGNREVFDNASFWEPRIKDLQDKLRFTYINKINSITSELWQ